MTDYSEFEDPFDAEQHATKLAQQDIDEQLQRLNLILKNIWREKREYAAQNLQIIVEKAKKVHHYVKDSKEKQQELNEYKTKLKNKIMNARIQLEQIKPKKDYVQKVKELISKKQFLPAARIIKAQNMVEQQKEMEMMDEFCPKAFKELGILELEANKRIKQIFESNITLNEMFSKSKHLIEFATTKTPILKAIQKQNPQDYPQIEKIAKGFDLNQLHKSYVEWVESRITECFNVVYKRMSRVLDMSKANVCGQKLRLLAMHSDEAKEMVLKAAMSFVQKTTQLVQLFEFAQNLQFPQIQKIINQKIDKKFLVRIQSFRTKLNDGIWSRVEMEMHLIEEEAREYPKLWRAIIADHLLINYVAVAAKRPMTLTIAEELSIVEQYAERLHKIWDLPAYRHVRCLRAKLVSDDLIELSPALFDVNETDCN